MPDRYILDPLYGRIALPEFIWRILSAPELQRLREVRLCNINSLCVTGASAVNRFEHSLGAAYLATQCAGHGMRHLSPQDQQHLVLAALLHDVGSPAFGHSVQYVLDLQGYRHDSLLDILLGSTSAGFTYRHATLEPVYFGLPRRLPVFLTKESLTAISEIVAGRGILGPLVSGTVDLDNLDNVARLAFHMGLPVDAHRTVALARDLGAEDGRVSISEDSLPHVAAWQKIRATMYGYLLLNPAEFSAKCMLEEALALALQRSRVEFKWHDVDSEVLGKLVHASPETAEIVSRLMIGDLYGCLALFETPDVEAYDRVVDPASRHDIEKTLQKSLRRSALCRRRKVEIALHAIKDAKKTHRSVDCVIRGVGPRTVGRSVTRALVGVFFRNKDLSLFSAATRKVADAVVVQRTRRLLKAALGTRDLQEITQYAEG